MYKINIRNTRNVEEAEEGIFLSKNSDWNSVEALKTQEDIKSIDKGESSVCVCVWWGQGYRQIFGEVLYLMNGEINMFI